MVEIFALIKLCRMNNRNAKSNNRKGWIYVLITIFMWFGMEMLGAIIGILIWGEHWLTYVVALIFAIVGGILSRFISNRKNPNNTVTSSPLN